MLLPTQWREKYLQKNDCAWLVLQLDFSKCNVAIRWNTEAIIFGNAVTAAKLLRMFATG